MALSVDGTVHGNAYANTINVTLTTSNSNDVIVVVALTNGGPITSVTASGLTFTYKTRAGTGASVVELWTAPAASPLASVVITVNSTTSNYFTVDAFGVSGADTSTIWDANASNPDIGTSAPRTISTDTADTFILGAFRHSAASPTAGAGFTIISGAHYLLSQQKIVSSTQSSLSVPIAAGTSNGCYAAAIIIASGGGSVTPTLMLLGIGV